MRRISYWLALGVLGCGPSGPSPKEGSSFGHFEVRAESAELGSLAEPLAVSVGGIFAYRVTREDSRTVRFFVQGAPEPGAQEVWASSRRGGKVSLGQLHYRPPAHPVFQRMVAFGASLTMGTQDGSISIHSQTYGPAAQLARAAGAYLSLPLVKEGFLPSLTHEDFDLATCRFKDSDVFSLLAKRASSELLPKLRDSEGAVHISYARVDPGLEVRNVAIGGFRVEHVLKGPGQLFATGLEHFVWNPMATTEELLYEPEEKMIDRVEAMRPTLIVSTDLFGNDYNNVQLGAEGVPDLSALTPMESFRASLAEVLARLEGTGAEVFLATGPDATVLPQYDEKVQKLREAGYSEAEATSWREAIRRRIGEYNAELLAQVEGRPRFHVVDLHAKVAEVLASGLEVGETRLSSRPLGGLLSLDGMHFTDTGYAALANEFVRAINQSVGSQVPEIDLAAVLAEDANSVERLREAGFSCAGQ
ncbi:MAG: hypothetical protein HYZ28_19745 [Myxococcales bacterium]|nr:hypothetical protein [Myxococcales bacterium]